MTFTIYSNPSSKATARPQRLFKTRRANRAWTMAVRAIRVVIASGRECAPRARASLRNRHQGPSIMGFEDEVEQSFRRPCRWLIGRSKRTYELTSSIVPRGTSFHRGVELDFLLLHWILHRSQAAAISLVHRNSVPSTHTRCMITANRRASATIAFFIPRCLATFIAQALSQDHFVERTSMLWAAS